MSEPGNPLKLEDLMHMHITMHEQRNLHIKIMKALKHLVQEGGHLSLSALLDVTAP